MDDKEFENYLAILGGMLRLSKRQRRAMSCELRDHLLEHVGMLVQSGWKREDAICKALEEFGDAAAVAAGFSRLLRERKRRWIMRMTIGSAAMIGLLAVGVYLYNAQVAPLPAVAQGAGPAGDIGGGGGLGGGQPSDGGAAPPSEGSLPNEPMSDAAEAADQATKRALQSLMDVEFVDTPLEEVVSYLASQGHFQFYFDRRSLMDAGIGADTPVNISLKQVPAEMVLDLMLHEMELVYRIRHGVLLIMTKDSSLATQHVVQIYLTKGIEASRLAELVTGTISPETWDGTGGNNKVQFLDEGILIVKAPSNLQAEISEFIQNLQSAVEEVNTVGKKY